MKKILAASAIALSIIACKKEGKIDDKNTEISNNGISATNSDAEKQVEEIKDIPAITDSAGVYKLKYKLEKGETYPLVMVQKNVDNMSMDNQSQSQTSETIDNISFTVTDFQNGIYDFDVTLKSKKQVGTDAQGNNLNVDTQGSEPQDEQLKMIWKINKALMGNTLKLKMTENGKILSITGFDPIYNKVVTALSSIKEKKDRDGILQGLKETFNENILKMQFKTNLSFFPEKGIKIGESFTETENLDPEGTIKSSTTFTLAKVDNEFAHFTIKGGIPKKSDKQEQNGITNTISLVGVQSGDINIDKNTGWMKNSKVTMQTTQTQTLSDGKQSQTGKQISVATTSINP